MEKKYEEQAADSMFIDWDDLDQIKQSVKKYHNEINRLSHLVKNYKTDVDSLCGIFPPIATEEEIEEIEAINIANLNIDHEIKVKAMEERLKNVKFPPLVTPEEQKLIDDFNTSYNEPVLRNDTSWSQTYTGKKFFPFDPRPEDICIEDIAHSLSMQCRFTGHSSFHYSIAQHSVLVSYFCDEKNALHGLMHDAAESFASDLNSVIKKNPQLSGYRELEDNIQKVICRKYGLSELEPADVKRADILVLGIEAKTVYDNLHPDWVFGSNPPPLSIIKMEPEEAEKLFIQRFTELMRK